MTAWKPEDRIEVEGHTFILKYDADGKPSVLLQRKLGRGKTPRVRFLTVWASWHCAAYPMGLPRQLGVMERLCWEYRNTSDNFGWQRIEG